MFYIMKKKIAIIGSHGQLGTDLLRVLGQNTDYQISPLTHRDIEITDKESVRTILDKIKPDIIINTAAYHRVNEIESNPEKAFMVNGIANKNLAEYTLTQKQTLIFFSSDYVFGVDKERNIPYRETDCPGPINIYGISKLIGEQIIRYTNPKHFIIRTTGLFGIAGSSEKGGNFVEIVLQKAKENSIVRMVDDQVSTPTYSLDLARQINNLLKTNEYGLYHATAEGYCSWYEFTKEIFKLTNIKVRLEPISSSELMQKVKRPSYSVLENANLKKLGINIMRSWKEGLKDYLKEKGYLR